MSTRTVSTPPQATTESDERRWMVPDGVDIKAIMIPETPASPADSRRERGDE